MTHQANQHKTKSKLLFLFTVILVGIVIVTLFCYIVISLVAQEQIDKVGSTASQVIYGQAAEPDNLYTYPKKITVTHGTIQWESNDYVQRSYQFFTENKTKYGILNPETEFKLAKENIDSLGITHITFQQYVGEIPVYGATVSLHFSDTGALNFANGTYVPGLSNISTSPNLTANETFLIAQNDLRAGASVQFSKEELIIYQDAIFSDKLSAPKLTWKFVASSGTFSSYTYFVDANSGEIIKHYSNFIN